MSPDRPARLLAGMSALAFVGAMVAGVTALRPGPADAPEAAPLPALARPTPVVVRAAALPVGRPLVPSTVSIDSIGRTDIPIVDATVELDRLTPPRDVRLAGIWTDGAALDATAGTTMLVGHVNYVGQGDGAFHDLAAVAPGSAITTVDRAGVGAAWTVTSIEVTVKKLGVDPAVFAGPTGARALVLVTCGGPFDPSIRSYENNVYVWAVPASTSLSRSDGRAGPAAHNLAALAGAAGVADYRPDRDVGAG